MGKDSDDFPCLHRMVQSFQSAHGSQTSPGYSPLQLHHNVPISEAPEAAKPPETDSATEKLILGEHALSVLSVLPNVI